MLLFDTWAIVPDFEDDLLVTNLRRNIYMALLIVFHCMQRIANEIHQHLFQLYGVCQYEYLLRGRIHMRIILADGSVLDTGDEQSKRQFAESHKTLLTYRLRAKMPVSSRTILSGRVKRPVPPTASAPPAVRQV